MNRRIQACVLLVVFACTIAYIVWYNEPSFIESRYDSLDSVQQFKKQYPEYKTTTESGFLHMVSISYYADLGEKTASIRIADFNGPLVFYSCDLKIQNDGRYSIFQIMSPDTQIISDYPCEETYKKDGYFVNVPQHVASIDPPFVVPINLSIFVPLFVLAIQIAFSIRLYIKKK